MTSFTADNIIFEQDQPRKIQHTGACFNSSSVEAYFEAIDQLLDYWPGILGEDAPKIGEGGSQAPGLDIMTVTVTCMFDSLHVSISLGALRREASTPRACRRRPRGIQMCKQHFSKRLEIQPGPECAFAPILTSMTFASVPESC